MDTTSNYKGLAYSLLEIMVALAILAGLTAIAVPSYQSHMNKGQVTDALNTLTKLELAAKIAYEENPANTSITYAGIDFPNNVVTALNAEPVVNGLYIRPGGHASVPAGQFLVCVFIGKLTFSGYVAPTPGNTGTNARVCKQVTAGSEIYTNKCGSLQASNLDVPTRYLPNGCNCANIWAGTC